MRRMRLVGPVLASSSEDNPSPHQQGSVCCEKIRQQFGDSVIQPNREINRRILGDLVFSDKLRLKQLTDIVWPEARRMLEKQIHDLQAQQQPPSAQTTAAPLLVIEAAVLLDAGWYVVGRIAVL